jgi:hypothetical protein
MCSNKYTRNCPSCGKTLEYKQKGHRDDAERKGRICVDCNGKSKKSPNQSLYRNCPSCDKVLTYPTAAAQRKANKDGRKCYNCANSSNFDETEQNKLTRICPSCNEVITHKKAYSRRRAENKKTTCSSCRAKICGIKLTKEIDLNKELVYVDYYINELTAAEIGIKYSKPTSYIHNALSKWGYTQELYAHKLHDEGKRKCKKCKEIKDLSEYRKSNRGLFGINSQCETCFKESTNSYYLNEQERAKLRAKEWRENNPDRARELSKIKVTKSRKENPHIHRMKGLLRRFIKATKQNKTTRTSEMLGYTYDDFKNHIQSFELPLIGNHVDHKCPISWFESNVPANVCNSLKNLQVISENENEVKSQWWSHPIEKLFFEEISDWIKQEYKSRFLLINDYYVDIKSPFYE